MNIIHTIEGLWSNFIMLIYNEFYYPYFILALFVGILVFLIMALIVIALIRKIKFLKENLPISHPVNGGMPIEEEELAEEEFSEGEISAALRREIAKRVSPAIEISREILGMVDVIIERLSRLESDSKHGEIILAEIMKEVFSPKGSKEESIKTDPQPPPDNEEGVSPPAKENLLVCPKCGAELLGEDNFCGICGEEVYTEQFTAVSCEENDEVESPVKETTSDSEPKTTTETISPAEEPALAPATETLPEDAGNHVVVKEGVEHPGEPLTGKEKEETPLLDENLDEEFISRNRKGMVGKKAKEKITAPGDESIIIVDKDEKITPEILDNALKYRVFLQLMRNLK